jgi:hypothetical protein
MKEKDKFYALFVIDETGLAIFGGAYKDRETAESKGQNTGKRFEVRPVDL